MTSTAERVAALPLKAGGHLLAAPIRLLGKPRLPAIEVPEGLGPGDRPDVGARLLVLYDGGCGICLHARDLFAMSDRTSALADDRIARHSKHLLGDLDEEDTFGSFHVVHPDGRRESGGDGLAALFQALWWARPMGAGMRRFPGPTEALYEWFANNRPWISQGTGLINHPQRDPDEQPDSAPGEGSA